MIVKKEHIDFEQQQVRIYRRGKIDRIGIFSANMNQLLKKYIEDWDDYLNSANRRRSNRAKVRGTQYVPIATSEYLFHTIRSPQISYSTVFKAIKKAGKNYYTERALNRGYTGPDVQKYVDKKVKLINTETMRHSRRAHLFSLGKSIDQVQAIMGDENRWVCRRYLKIAQQLYPESFLK